MAIKNYTTTVEVHKSLGEIQAALASQQRREIKIKRYARVIEGHVLDFKPDKRRRHP